MLCTLLRRHKSSSHYLFIGNVNDYTLEKYKIHYVEWIKIIYKYNTTKGLKIDTIFPQFSVGTIWHIDT